MQLKPITTNNATHATQLNDFIALQWLYVVASVASNGLKRLKLNFHSSTIVAINGKTGISIAVASSELCELVAVNSNSNIKLNFCFSLQSSLNLKSEMSLYIC